LTTSTLPAGTNTLTIVYGGDPVYQIIKRIQPVSIN
jgi:hypothetical protein